jgi:hypothetical protein
MLTLNKVHNPDTVSICSSQEYQSPKLREVLRKFLASVGYSRRVYQCPDGLEQELKEMIQSWHLDIPSWELIIPTATTMAEMAYPDHPLELKNFIAVRKKERIRLQVH